MAFTDIFKTNELKAANLVLEKEKDNLKSEIKRLNEIISDKTYAANQLEKKVAEQIELLHSFCSLSDFEKLKVPYFFDTLQELWMKWNPSIHESDVQLIRQERASNALLSPLDIDPRNGCGHFRGENSDYYTTLAACECMDHQRRGLPCKHMYRLAYEFDIFMIENVQYVPDVRKLLRFSDVKNIINQLSYTKRVILNMTLTNNGSAFEIDSDLKSLIALHMVDISENKKEVLNHYKRDILYSLLPANPVIRIPKSIKKSDLIDVIIRNYPDITSNLEKLVAYVKPHESISHLSSQILALLCNI